MKKRIVLSAIIGAAFAGIFYPTADLATRLIAVAVSFFVLLGILFCTMLIGSRDEPVPETGSAQTPAAGKKKVALS